VAAGRAQERVGVHLQRRLAGRGQVGEGGDAARLDRGVLGVLERQIEDAALEQAELVVEARVDAGRRQLQRVRVGGEGLGLSAVDVARELVEQHDQRQPAARARGPVIELAARIRAMGARPLL